MNCNFSIFYIITEFNNWFNSFFISRLRTLYKEGSKEKVPVSEIRGEILAKYGEMSKTEAGTIVKTAFPSVVRKKHCSGSDYFYQPLIKIAKQSAPCSTSFQGLTEGDLKDCLAFKSYKLEEEACKSQQLDEDLKEKNKELEEATQKLKDKEEELLCVKETSSADRKELSKKLNNAMHKIGHMQKIVTHTKKSAAACKSSTLSKLTIISADQLEVPKKGEIPLGEGTFGECYLRHYRNIPVCVKYFQTCSYNEVIKEANIMLELQGHPNLPILFGISAKSQSPSYLITKFHGNDRSVKRSTLSAIVRSNSQCLKKEEAFKIAFDCSRGIMHIHNMGILHNDIKGNNIVVEKLGGRLSPVIIDFGKSCKMSEATYYHHVPISERAEYSKRYPQVAPELIKRTHIRSKYSDIYSFGRVLQIIGSKHPGLESTIDSCLLENPSKRPSIDTICDSISKCI